MSPLPVIGVRFYLLPILSVSLWMYMFSDCILYSNVFKKAVTKRTLSNSGQSRSQLSSCSTRAHDRHGVTFHSVILPPKKATQWAVIMWAGGKVGSENEAVGGETVWKDESTNGYKQRYFHPVLTATCCTYTMKKWARGAALLVNKLWTGSNVTAEIHFYLLYMSLCIWLT